MLYDVQNWVKSCQHCKTAKGPYTDPEQPQGSIVANNPTESVVSGFYEIGPK